MRGWRRLKLRELLLPKVVDRGEMRERRGAPEAGSNGASNGSGNIWAVPADLFPCELPQGTRRLVDEVSALSRPELILSGQKAAVGLQVG